MARDARATIHFMDGSRIVVRYKRLSGRSMALAGMVRKAIEAERLLVEVKGNLLVIPTRNVKYIEVAPAPDALPSEVLRDAEIAYEKQ